MSNLRAALEQYDAQQRRQAALQEAQRIGTLIHLQEQQLVAAKHLAKQRANAYRQRQQLQFQQTQDQELLYRPQQSQPALTPLPELAECAIDDEDDSPLPSLLASASLAPSGSAPGSTRHGIKKAERTGVRISEDRGTTRPLNVQPPTISPTVSSTDYLLYPRRPRECDAILCPRTDWKPDQLSVSCDNIRCPVRFSLLGERRHHCRLCGNIFCAACLPHKEVLHDMTKLPWNYMPEMFIASLFPPPPQELKQEPISPATTPSLLSSSYESGSSRASAYSDSSSSQFDSTNPSAPHTLYSGTDKQIQWPIPDHLRQMAISTATEHKICTDCHARIHNLPVPSDLFEERVALHEIREEIAWSMWLLGLDKWDQTLRKHGLTIRSTPAQRKVQRKLVRRESVMSSSTEATDVSSHFTSSSEVSNGASSANSQSHPTIPTATSAPPTVDACERPLDFQRYAWPTAPSFIRFTSKALAPPPLADPEPEPIPSAFGARKSPARYLLPIRPPVPPVEPPKPTEQEIEADRQARYEAALTEYKREAYDLAYARPCFRRSYSLPVSRDCDWFQSYTEPLVKWWYSSTPPPPFVVSGDYGWEDKARHEARRLAAHRASWVATSKRWARFAYSGVWTTPEEELTVVLD